MSSREAWAIEPLHERHLRDAFSCGEPSLDEYLEKFARKNQDRDISRTYVAVKSTDPRVLGYYTLTGRTLEAKKFPAEEVRRFPRYPVPVVHLARLAVDQTVQGQGIGQALLASALKKAVLASQILGFYAVEAHALTPKARGFYMQYQFRALPDDPFHLYLPIATIRQTMK